MCHVGWPPISKRDTPGALDLRHVGASHTCSVRTCTHRTIISRSPAVLSTCCPQANRATDTGPIPVRSWYPLGHPFFSAFPFFRIDASERRAYSQCSNTFADPNIPQKNLLFTYFLFNILLLEYYTWLQFKFRNKEYNASEEKRILSLHFFYEIFNILDLNKSSKILA